MITSLPILKVCPHCHRDFDFFPQGQGLAGVLEVQYFEMEFDNHLLACKIGKTMDALIEVSKGLKKLNLGGEK